MAEETEKIVGIWMISHMQCNKHPYHNAIESMEHQRDYLNSDPRLLSMEEYRIQVMRGKERVLLEIV